MNTTESPSIAMASTSLKNSDILNLFLSMSEWTVPSGLEEQFAMEKLIPFLNEQKLPFERDIATNIIVKIPNVDGTDSRTMFTAHMDDVSPKRVKVVHILEDKRYIATDGKSILGADNKAGVTVLLSLLQSRVPGIYAFFISEECGCIGSSRVADLYQDKLDRVISFDRKAYGSIITHQSYGRTCSELFSEELSLRLAYNGLFYESDDGGIYTDSNSFAPYVSECTNLSVGMHNCHSNREKLDLLYFVQIVSAFCKVDWETLPAERDCKEAVKRNTYKYGGYPERDYNYGSSWGHTGASYADYYGDDDLGSLTAEAKRLAAAELGYPLPRRRYDSFDDFQEDRYHYEDEWTKPVKDETSKCECCNIYFEPQLPDQLICSECMLECNCALCGKDMEMEDEGYINHGYSTLEFGMEENSSIIAPFETICMRCYSHHCEGTGYQHIQGEGIKEESNLEHIQRFLWN